MKNTDVYYVRKEEKCENYMCGNMYWWNIRPEGCNWIDRYLGINFKEAVQRYKEEHAIRGGKFIQKK